MSEPQRSQVTEADVESFKAKLQQFAAALTPAEQVVLGLLLEHVGSEGDVQGHTATPTVTPSAVAALRTSFYTGSPAGYSTVPGSQLLGSGGQPPGIVPCF